MKHHLKKQTWHIKDGKICCDYCQRPIDLHSEHHAELHYKTFNCTCGKKIIMKVNFHGSGHDDIKSKLEEKMKDDSKSA